MALRRGDVLLLDGPMGSLLAARGVPTPPPLWSAAALTTAEAEVVRVHADYAASGATVHTAATFRTKERQAGPEWESLTRKAVKLARDSVPPEHRVAGSLSPLEDCYRPDLSPRDPRPEHREMACALADAGVDLVLCETFPHIGEALIAVEEAARTGLPTWVSFTAGPHGELLTPKEIAAGAREAVSRGASAVMVNCTAASETWRYVEALAEVASLAKVPFGAYANAGDPEEAFNRGAEDPAAAQAYLAEALRWVDAGATIVGSCCGTGPLHIAALAKALVPSTRGASGGVIRGGFAPL
ncbi:MAG: homocysteine S-methyltransferase family protein [Polyangiaceae bacterium]